MRVALRMSEALPLPPNQMYSTNTRASSRSPAHSRWARAEEDLRGREKEGLAGALLGETCEGTGSTLGCEAWRPVAVAPSRPPRDGWPDADVSREPRALGVPRLMSWVASFAIAHSPHVGHGGGRPRVAAPGHN